VCAGVGAVGTGLSSPVGTSPELRVRVELGWPRVRVAPTGGQVSGTGQGMDQPREEIALSHWPRTCLEMHS